MNDEEFDSQPGYSVGDDGRDGSGRGGGDDEPTLVIVPRISRPSVSKGVRLLAAAFGQLRKSLYEFSELVDQGTALGALELSVGEAKEIDDFLTDAKRQINGVRSSLRRATRPQTTNGTNGETL